MEKWSFEKEQNKGLQSGHLLLSEPFMWDPNFSRTVVLITEHDEKGTIGFVQNRAVNLKLHEAIEDFPESDLSVFYGGPCEENTLHFIHTLGEQIDGSVLMRDGLYWGGNFETIKILIEKNLLDDTQIKFFLGYSGWSAGQLEIELKENSWIVANSFPLSQLLGTGQQHLWKKIMSDMGGIYKTMSLYPTDPNLN